MAVSPMLGIDEADAELVQQVEREAGPFVELGVTGLRRSAGYVDEEFLPQLRGRKGVQVFHEMEQNDPIVGAMLFAVIQLIRNTDWTVIPAGKSKEHAAAAKLVETCMEDMSHSWDDMISEILSSLVYGWSWHVPVYKRRNGPWQRDGRQRSKYTDGLIGWRKIPIRAQETMQRWAFDESGDVTAMVQLAPPDYQMRVLPLSRSLLFRFGAYKNNPEGRSMLRNAYRPWFYKKRLEEFESVGIERDLAGLPMVTVPASWLSAPAGSQQAKQVDAFKRMIRGIRRNEQEGLVFPSAYDQETKQPLFKMELLAGGGTRAFSTNDIIQRYENRILMTILADFIMIGHQRVGTYNLHLDKTGIFRTALNSVAQAIADIFNRHAIPRLFAINGWKPAELPRIQASDVDAPDIAQLAAFLTATAGLGFSWGPDADMERYLRQAAGLPELREDDYRKRRVEARRVEATRFAQEQTEYLAARSQLAQATAAAQMQAAGVPSAEDQAEAQGLASGAQAQQTGASTERRAEEAHQTAQQGAKLAQTEQKLSISQQRRGGPGASRGSRAQSRSSKAARPAKKTAAKPLRRTGASR